MQPYKMLMRHETNFANLHHLLEEICMSKWHYKKEEGMHLHTPFFMSRDENIV